MTNTACKVCSQNRRRRSGSVLILVVVLLVLVFLMGTAYMVTTRTDRYAAEQFRSGSQSDMATESVRDAVEAAIVADSPFMFTAAGANFWDCATNGTATDDLYLAERYPEWHAAGAFPYWASVSWPTTSTGTVRPFVDPSGQYVPPAIFGTTLGQLQIPAGTAKNTYCFRPAVTTVNGKVVPALYIYDNTLGTLYTATPFPAADADGDGVADSVLFEVPQVSGDGLTYLAAIRVVDNCAAINANTAWSNTWDFGLNGGAFPITAGTYPLQGALPTQVGLLEMLPNLVANAGDPTVGTFTLNNFMPSTPATITAATGQNEHRNLYNARAGLQLTNGYMPNTPVEQVWGFNTGGLHGPYRDDLVESNGASSVNYRWASMGDAFSSQLARRLLNPGYAADAPRYTGDTQRFQAFAEADTLTLAQAFCLANDQVSPSRLEQVLQLSLRGAAVQKAPYPLTAAGIKQWFDDNFNWGQTLALSDDPSATTNRPASSIRPYLVTSNPVSQRVLAHTVLTGATEMGANAATPVKACINTADFATLYRAFWNVVCNPNTYPGYAFPTGSDTLMFSDVARGGTAIPTTDVMALRAAIAANNAIAMRGGPGTTPQTITLPGSGCSAEIYPITAQPFITEVLTDVPTSGTNYLALELTGPVAVGLDQWRLGYINPTTKVFTLLHTFGTADSVGPGTFIVLESSSTRPSGVPTPSGAPITVPNLENALDNELVVLPPAIPAPADQVDLRGTVPTAGSAARYIYQRGTTGWEVAWPGRYDSTVGKPTVGLVDATTSTAVLSFGAANTTTTVTPVAVPLFDALWPGGNKMTTLPYLAPFGQFARDGDILRVPFIASYRIYNPSGDVVLNSPTMDLCLTDPTATAGANMGRFVPGVPPVTGYEWTSRLFDYVTATNVAADDYMPNVDRTATPPAPQVPLPVPNGPVLDYASPPANVNEAMVPTQGRININTASWRVLAALPLVPATNVDTAGAAGVLDYLEVRDGLAKQILLRRKTGNNQFTSIADLNNVPHFPYAGFEDPAGTWTDQLPAAPGALWGEYANVNTGFERDNLMLSRISNLITTRTDSFTVYITVQAWRNYGTTTATMDSERRTAYLMDRSGVTTNNPHPRVVPIPTR